MLGELFINIQILNIAYNSSSEISIERLYWILTTDVNFVAMQNIFFFYKNIFWVYVENFITIKRNKAVKLI